MLVRIMGCCLWFVVSAVNAQDVRLRWLLNDFPPFTEVDGQVPGRGIADGLLSYLQAHMPQYRHEFEVASFARAYALMERGEPVCHPTTLKMSEREQAMLFSRPVLFMPSQQVLIRNDRLDRVAPYLDAQGRVDVQRLLNDPQLVTAISERRGYSPSISRALAKQGSQPQVLKAGVNFSAPFQQLRAGWIDYLFAYPVELGWYYRLHQDEPAIAIRRLGIAGDPPYMLGYIACTHSTWGEQVIHDIDQQLRQAGPRPPWTERVIEFTANEDRESYERALVEQRPFAQP